MNEQLEIFEEINTLSENKVFLRGTLLIEVNYYNPIIKFNKKFIVFNVRRTCEHKILLRLVCPHPIYENWNLLERIKIKAKRILTK
jgi:hypothetical protein